MHSHGLLIGLHAQITAGATELAPWITAGGWRTLLTEEDEEDSDEDGNEEMGDAGNAPGDGEEDDDSEREWAPAAEHHRYVTDDNEEPTDAELQEAEADAAAVAEGMPHGAGADGGSRCGRRPCRARRALLPTSALVVRQCMSIVASQSLGGRQGFCLLHGNLPAEMRSDMQRTCRVYASGLGCYRMRIHISSTRLFWHNACAECLFRPAGMDAYPLLRREAALGEHLLRTDPHVWTRAVRAYPVRYLGRQLHAAHILKGG